MRRWIVALLLTLTACSSSSKRLSDLEKKRRETETAIREGQMYLRQVLPQILADQKFIYEHNLLPKKTKGQRDAGDFLNDRIPFYAVKADGSGTVACGAITRPLRIPKAVLEKLSPANSRPNATKWMHQAEEIDFSKIDLTWMKELHKFDYWTNPNADRPAQRLCPPRDNVDSSFIPRLWGKLRLLKGSRDGDLSQAIDEFHHLKKLVYTWGTFAIFVPTMEADERDFFESISARDRPKRWKPLNREISKHVDRFMFTYMNLISRPDVIPEDIFEALYLNPFSDAGFCTAFDNQFVLEEVAKRSMEIPDSYLEKYKILDSKFRKNCSGLFGHDALWNYSERSYANLTDEQRLQEQENDFERRAGVFEAIRTFYKRSEIPSDHN